MSWRLRDKLSSLCGPLPTASVVSQDEVTDLEHRRALTLKRLPWRSLLHRVCLKVNASLWFFLTPDFIMPLPEFKSCHGSSLTVKSGLNVLAWCPGPPQLAPYFPVASSPAALLSSPMLSPLCCLEKAYSYSEAG